MAKLKSPEILNITDEHGVTCFGASQEWYKESWKRTAGCGPTNCAHMLWYLSQTREDCSGLVTIDGQNKADFLELMENVWKYVTPHQMGVNSTGYFCKGALNYGWDRGIPLSCQILDIPKRPFLRPKRAKVVEFLNAALIADLPVAFLNLSNGTLKNLDNWHWVTMVEFDDEKMTAVICDQGKRFEIDLGRWLRTSWLGGGFVTLEKE